MAKDFEVIRAPKRNQGQALGILRKSTPFKSRLPDRVFVSFAKWPMGLCGETSHFPNADECNGEESPELSKALSRERKFQAWPREKYQEVCGGGAVVI